MTSPVALVSNVLEFAGAPAAAALAEAGFRVALHDRRFIDAAARDRHASQWPHAGVLAAQEPDAIVEEVVEKYGRLDLVVSNDAYPAVVGPIESVDPSEMRATLQRLVVFPFLLARAAVPRLKASTQGRIVFVTSNRTHLPVPGGAIPDAARAGANALVKSLSVELAPFGIAVNAVAPNFLYSESYYPREKFIENKAGREFVRDQVPLGRLGEPAEIGEVIRFLATCNASFMTGAIIDFSGGWPAGKTFR